MEGARQKVGRPGICLQQNLRTSEVQVQSEKLAADESVEISRTYGKLVQAQASAENQVSGKDWKNRCRSCPAPV